LVGEAEGCASECEHAAAMASSCGESATRRKCIVRIRFHFETP
jgi:hypothetical protein